MVNRPSGGKQVCRMINFWYKFFGQLRNTRKFLPHENFLSYSLYTERMTSCNLTIGYCQMLPLGLCSNSTYDKFDVTHSHLLNNGVPGKYPITNINRLGLQCILVQ